MRRDLTAIAKRVELVKKRALAAVIPVVEIVTVDPPFDWRAFRAADVETRDRMRADYAEREAEIIAANPPPDMPYIKPGSVVQIVVRFALPTEYQLDGDDEDDDLPGGMTAEQYEAAMRYREQVIEEGRRLADEEAARAAEPVVEIDRYDATPDGDPSEVLFYEERSGYPVTRRDYWARKAHIEEQKARIAATNAHIEATRRDRR